jgi:hypothetical protein
MGISTHYYTFYGVKLSYPEDENFTEALYEKSSTKFDYILDGMSGDYFLLGKILFDSGDLRWSDIEDTWVNIPLDKLDDYDKIWREGFQEDFPEYAQLIEGQVSKLITLAHYS